MKRIFTLLFLILQAFCFAQTSEFGKTENGLIYPDTTLKKLKFIVDSLNTKHRAAEQQHNVYYSKLQAKAHFILLQHDVKNAKNDMDANIPFEDFIAKYSCTTIEKDLLVLKYNFKEYGKEVLDFENFAFTSDKTHELEFSKDLKQYDVPLKGKWVYQYYKKTKDDDGLIEAFYFTEDLHQQPIPEKYAKLIRYADCLVDTASQIFYPNDRDEFGERGGVSKVKEFMAYLHQYSKPPEYDYKSSEPYKVVNDRYEKQYHLWESSRLRIADSLKSNDPKFNNLFAAAVNDTLEKGYTNNEFEEYVGRYYSKKAELELKRNREVTGTCSQDNGPRIHAYNIAVLSAETTNWGIFLRSHLDIINDHFDRTSDGSYAWAGRKTYIKELEVLDVNTFDLFLGISLRMQNPAKNHYYGSIGRLGRALSESDKPGETVTEMLEMVADTTLDDYNRMLIYCLYLNAANNEERKTDKEKLTAAVNTLPEYLAIQLKEK